MNKGAALLVVGGGVATIVALTRGAGATPPPGPRSIVASDDYVISDAYGLIKGDSLVVGYSGGDLFDKTVGVMVFSGLPRTFTRALLHIFPIEYLNPFYKVSIQVGPAVVLVDDGATPTPLVADITTLITGPNAQVILSPETPPGTENFLRKYGSIRGPVGARPYIEFS